MNRTFKKTVRSLLAGVVCAGCCFAGKEPVPPFEPGQQVVFLGDSITHFGKWWPLIWSGYLEQFPENPPRFFSAGFSGDTASGALTRLERDVFSKNPDAVCIMFGMNDVMRVPDTYEESMDELLRQITEKGIRCIVVTPSPYDQTLVNPQASALDPVRGDRVAAAAQIARQLAKHHDCDIIDFHAPMTQLNAERQRSDPSASIIGPDRVHPGAEGSQIMARLFLEAQGIDAAPVEMPPALQVVVDLERNHRNIQWLETRVLKKRGIDPADIAACKTFFRQTYEPRGAADENRVESYLKWRGSEEQLQQALESSWRRMKEKK